MLKKRKGTSGPVMVMAGMTIFIVILSLILNKLGIRGYITEAATLETSLVTVNNVLSKDGIKFILNNSVMNFKLLEPLAIVVMALIAISITESSGLLKDFAAPLKKIKPKYVTLITVFIGIISTIIGDYSYALLLPLAGIIYKYIGRDSSLGVLTMFVAITIGYCTGLIYNYQDYVLGTITQTAASGIDKTYELNLLSNIFIMLASTIILTIIGTIVIEKLLSKRFHRNENTDNLIVSKKARIATLITAVVIGAIFVYSIVPGLPFSGILLDNTEDTYIAKLFGDTAILNNSLMLIVIGALMICGFVYGKISRNIKNSRDYSKGLTSTFENTGYIFVLMFFASIMIGILEWTNIGTIIAVNLVDFLSKLQFSGNILILLIFLAVIIISILIPSTITKWNLIAPVLVPLMMRANITPSFAQFIFSAADSVGKCFSPFYIYFIIMIGFIYKFNNDEHTSIFNTMRKIMPIVLILLGVWLIILIGWNLIGIPVGIETTTTI